MADIALQLNEALIERLHIVAQARRCSIENLIVQLLQELLPAVDAPVEPNEIGPIATHWNHEEVAFLEDIVQAFDEVPASDTSAAAESNEWDQPLS